MISKKKVSNKLTFLLKVYTCLAFTEHCMFSVVMLFCFVSFSFWLCYVACGILSFPNRDQPQAPAERVLSPKHWNAREFPAMLCLLIFIYPMAQPVLTQNNIPLSWCLMTCM